jgi:iron complex outermembrane receptor protein
MPGGLLQLAAQGIEDIILAQDPQISSRGFGARSAFGVRGLRVYVDGIPLSMPDGIGNPGSIDLGVVSSVEVMRGPFSAMYGNSSGGVIQMFTEAAPATPQISAEALYGSFNTERQAVSATGTQKGVEYLLNYSNFSSDGYRQNSASEKRQATAKIATSLDERTKLTTMINWFDQTAQDPGGLFRTGTASTPGALTQNTYYNPAGVSLSSLNNLARVIRSNTQVGFNLEHQLDANNTLNAVVYAGQRQRLSKERHASTRARPPRRRCVRPAPECSRRCARGRARPKGAPTPARSGRRGRG